MERILKLLLTFIFTLHTLLGSALVLSDDSTPKLLTQERDWRTIIINGTEHQGVISYTGNETAGMLGASCESDGQKYNHVHFVTPSYKPLIRKGDDGLNYVDIYLKAGATEFSTSLLAGKSASGTDRLYYPTYQANGSIIQRLIEAKTLSVSYRLANGEPVTESFSLMGYTHNVTANVNLCKDLNRKITLSTMANTPENNRPSAAPSKGETTEASMGQGTCFAVSSEGHLVTNDHVVQGAKKITIRLSNGSFYEARLIKTTSSTDLALLKIDVNTKNFLPIKTSRTVKKGDRVFTVGYPMATTLGIESKYTEGVISSMSGLNDEPLVYQVTVPIHPGNSGGPLVNESGQVVGIITSTASSLEFFKESGVMPQNINWAVKSDYLLPLLDVIPSREKSASRRGAIKSTEEAVCMVITTL